MKAHDETPDALREAERRIFEHPGYRQYAELRALERSITAVFVPNLEELSALLEAASTDESLAFELIQNVREPLIRERFHAVTTQRLHNYLASVQSLVDHVRWLMRKRAGSIAEDFERRKQDLLRNSEVPFMVDLRNFTLHRTLPFLAHRLEITNVNTPEQTMESEVELSVAQLLEWAGWSGPTRTYLEAQGDAMVLRPVVKKHGELVLGLNAWLHNGLSRANEEALKEVNGLIVARNAILVGGDTAEAERISRKWDSNSEAEMES